MLSPRTAVLAAVLASASFISTAAAQVREVAPWYAFVPAKSPVHSGEGDRFYKVTDAPAQAVLIADAEVTGWTRVWYPPGTTAFARAEDVSVEGQTAKLSREARLKAGNLLAGYGASFKTIGPFPAGTACQIVEPVRETPDGPIVAYRVIAPPGSSGFVESRLLRKATDAEISAFRAANTLPDLPPTPASVLAAATPAPAPVAPAAPTPSAPGASPIVLTQPPVTGDAGAPTAPPASPQDSGEPAATTVIVPRPVEIKVDEVQRLEPAFQGVLKQPVLTSEVDELIAQYQRVLSTLTTDQSARAKAVQQRIGALELRREYREKLRSLEAGRASLDRDQGRLTKQIEDIEASRYYTIVGELQPSLVYDGQRLPQMYRVVSIGAVSPRTLGYLRKTDGIDLNAMLGRVVGVIGEAQLDRSLQLNIITPVHVDILRTRAVTASPAPAATTPPAAPTTPQ